MRQENPLNAPLVSWIASFLVDDNRYRIIHSAIILIFVFVYKMSITNIPYKMFVTNILYKLTTTNTLYVYTFYPFFPNTYRYIWCVKKASISKYLQRDAFECSSNLLFVTYIRDFDYTLVPMY